MSMTKSMQDLARLNYTWIDDAVVYIQTLPPSLYETIVTKQGKML